MNSIISIRPATPADVPLVAWTVLTALDLPTDDLRQMIESCADKNSMYSWCNALIAFANNTPIGCIISYPGDRYVEMREYTWSKLWNNFDMQAIHNIPLETHPGQYYLDSMAIKPEARGLDVGHMLMQAAINHGKSLGYNNFALIVNINKPRLKAYYEKLGFIISGKLPFFGHDYFIMTAIK